MCLIQAAFASVTVWLFPAPVEMTSELSKELTSEDLSEVGVFLTVQAQITYYSKHNKYRPYKYSHI